MTTIYRYTDLNPMMPQEAGQAVSDGVAKISNCIDELLVDYKPSEIVTALVRVLASLLTECEQLPAPGLLGSLVICNAGVVQMLKLKLLKDATKEQII